LAENIHHFFRRHIIAIIWQKLISVHKAKVSLALVICALNVIAKMIIRWVIFMFTTPLHTTSAKRARL